MPPRIPNHPARFRPRGPQPEPLEEGQKLHDTQDDRYGVVLDAARQYSHPKAAPVFSYLVKWDDGEIQAISEAALDDGHGLELID